MQRLDISSKDIEHFNKILDAKIVPPGMSYESIQTYARGQELNRMTVGSHVFLDEFTAHEIAIGSNPRITDFSDEHVRAFQLAQAMHDEPIRVTDPSQLQQLSIALAHVRGQEHLFLENPKLVLDYLRMISSQRKLQNIDNAKYNQWVEKYNDIIKNVEKLIPNAKLISHFISLKKINGGTSGLTLDDWKKIPASVRSREFLGEVSIDDKIHFSPSLNEHISALYRKDTSELLQTNTLLVEKILSKFSDVKFSQQKTNSPATPLEEKITHALENDKVLLHSLNKIQQHLVAVREEEGLNKNLANNIQGMKQAIASLDAFGSLCGSQTIKNSAALLNHGFDLALTVPPLVGKTLPSSLLSMGATLGQVGTIFSAVMGIYSVFKKKKKDNQTPAVILAYLQSITHQITHLHTNMLKSFKIVIDNQQQIMSFLIQSIENITVLIRNESRTTQREILDLKKYLTTEFNSTAKLITLSGQSIHSQPLYILLSQTDRFIKSERPKKSFSIQELQDGLANWVDYGCYFSASPLQTGSIKLIAKPGSFLSFINSEFTDIERIVTKKPEILWENTAIFAEIAENLMDGPLSQDELVIDTKALPNPLIWLQAALKYLELRENYSAILPDEKEMTLSSAMIVAKNVFQFIKFLQTNPKIYQLLFAAYENALNDTQKIIQKIVDERADEWKKKLPPGCTFDLTKNFEEILGLNQEIVFQHQELIGDIFKTSFNRLPNGYCHDMVLQSYSEKISTNYKIIGLNEVLKEQKQNVFLTKALFSNRFGLKKIKMLYQLDLKQPGGKDMGVLTFKVDTEEESGVKKLFDLQYHIDGNTDKYIPWWETCNRGSSVIYSNASGFDSDFAASVQELRSFFPIYFHNVKVNSFVESALAKKRFAKIDFSPEFKDISNSLSDQLDKHVLKLKKEIIHEICEGKVSYQSELTKAYATFDAYRRLILCYITLAGMEPPLEILSLPSSTILLENASKYLDHGTIQTPWPFQVSKDTIAIAKETVLQTISREEKDRLLDMKIMPTESPYNFASPLQIAMSEFSCNVIDFLSKTQKNLTSKQLSKNDETFLEDIEKQCLRHFKLQKHWAKKVDISFEFSDDLTQSITQFESLSEKKCDDAPQKCIHLSKLLNSLLETHNLLATYFSTYPLKVDFAMGFIKQLQQMQRKLIKNTKVSLAKTLPGSESKPTEMMNPGKLGMFSKFPDERKLESTKQVVVRREGLSNQ